MPLSLTNYRIHKTSSPDIAKSILKDAFNQVDETSKALVIDAATERYQDTVMQDVVGTRTLMDLYLFELDLARDVARLILKR